MVWVRDIVRGPRRARHSGHPGHRRRPFPVQLSSADRGRATLAVLAIVVCYHVMRLIPFTRRDFRSLGGSFGVAILGAEPAEAAG